MLLDLLLVDLHVCSNGSHEPVVFCWCEKRAESLQTTQFYRTHTDRDISCCHVSVYQRVHESQAAFHYMCVCVWRLWSLSVCKIAVVLCARARKSRVTGESDRERQTDRMKDSKCSFSPLFIKMRWLFHWAIHLHQPAGFKWAGVTALPVQITDIYTAHFPFFKRQTHTQIKRPHTYTQRDHTHNLTNSFIIGYMHVYVCVCDLKHA